MEGRLRAMLLSAVLVTTWLPGQACAMSFDIRDDTDRYLDAPGLFDLAAWECIATGITYDCALATGIATGSLYAGGWDLNTLTFVAWDDLQSLQPDPPRQQQNVIDSLTLQIRLKDDDEGILDFGERAHIGVGIRDPLQEWDIEVDGDTLTYTVPAGDLVPYSDWQNVAIFGVAAYINDFKIDYIRAFGDYTPVGPAPVPEPGTLALFGLGLTGLALSRKRTAA